VIDEQPNNLDLYFRTASSMWTFAMLGNRLRFATLLNALEDRYRASMSLFPMNAKSQTFALIVFLIISRPPEHREHMTITFTQREV